MSQVKLPDTKQPKDNYDCLYLNSFKTKSKRKKNEIAKSGWMKRKLIRPRMTHDELKSSMVKSSASCWPLWLGLLLFVLFIHKTQKRPDGRTEAQSTEIKTFLFGSVSLFANWRTDWLCFGCVVFKKLSVIPVDNDWWPRQKDITKFRFFLWCSLLPLRTIIDLNKHKGRLWQNFA